MASLNVDPGRTIVLAEVLAEFRHGEEWDDLAFWSPLDKTWTVKSSGKGYSVERRLALNEDRGGLILLEEQITHRLPAGPGVIAEVAEPIVSSPKQPRRGGTPTPPAAAPEAPLTRIDDMVIEL